MNNIKDQNKFIPFLKLLTSAKSHFYLSLFISILLITTLFSELNENGYHWFFSSDALYLPSIYKDIFTDGNSFWQWQLNPSPNFFPDMIIYFIIMFFTKENFLISTLVYSIVQYSFIIILFKAILNRIMNQENAYRIAAISNLLLSLFFLSSIFNNEHYLSFYLIINSYHTSVLLITLFTFLLAFNYLKKGSVLIFILLMITLFLCGVSDRLMLVTSLSALFIICSFYWKMSFPRTRVVKLLFFIPITALLSYKTFNVLNDSDLFEFSRPHQMFSFENIIPSLNGFVKDIAGVFNSFNWNSILMFFAIIGILLLLIQAIKHILKPGKLSDFSFLIIYLAAFSTSNLIAPIINGSYAEIDCLRYNIYPFYIGLMVLPLFLFQYGKKVSLVYKILYPTLITYLLIIGTSNFTFSKLEKFVNYYPESVEAFDNIVDKHDLKMGIANHWLSKKTSMFSKKNMKIVLVHDVLTKRYHVSNKEWFHNKIFNFIIVDDLNENKIKEVFKLDTLIYILNNPKVIKVPEFKFIEEEWEPVLIKKRK